MREDGVTENATYSLVTYERTMSERTVYPGTLTYPRTVPTIGLFRPAGKGWADYRGIELNGHRDAITPYLHDFCHRVA